MEVQLETEQGHLYQGVSIESLIRSVRMKKNRRRKPKECTLFKKGTVPTQSQISELREELLERGWESFTVDKVLKRSFECEIWVNNLY